MSGYSELKDELPYHKITLCKRDDKYKDNSYYVYIESKSDTRITKISLEDYELYEIANKLEKFKEFHHGSV